MPQGIPPRDAHTGRVHVAVDTPAGSRNKYRARNWQCFASAAYSLRERYFRGLRLHSGHTGGGWRCTRCAGAAPGARLSGPPRNGKAHRDAL